MSRTELALLGVLLAVANGGLAFLTALLFTDPRLFVRALFPWDGLQAKVPGAIWIPLSSVVMVVLTIATGFILGGVGLLLMTDREIDEVQMERIQIWLDSFH